MSVQYVKIKSCTVYFSIAALMRLFVALLQYAWEGYEIYKGKKWNVCR
jgi:hypothetical protein